MGVTHSISINRSVLVFHGSLHGTSQWGVLRDVRWMRMRFWILRLPHLRRYALAEYVVYAGTANGKAKATTTGKLLRDGGGG